MVLSIRITKSILAGNQPFGWNMIISLSQQITACVINTCMQGKTTLRTTVRYAASLTPCNECMHACMSTGCMSTGCCALSKDL